MYNAVLFMNIIIHLLLKLRDLYSSPDGSNFNIYKLGKKNIQNLPWKYAI